MNPKIDMWIITGLIEEARLEDKENLRRCQGKEEIHLNPALN